MKAWAINEQYHVTKNGGYLLSLVYLIAESIWKPAERDALNLIFNVFLMHALAQELYLLLGGVHSREYQDRKNR